MSVELLRYSLEQKRAVLLLGAGFSLGATSKKYGPVPSAQNLIKNLYQHCFVDNKPPIEMLDDIEGAEEFKENYDLKQLCSLLREEGKDRLQLRNNYLKDVFYKCSVQKEDFHYYLTEYPWEKIFTLNIDDLVEFLYKTCKRDLNVWNNKNDDRRNDESKTLLVKLHGCVNNPNEGYVFDNTEYTHFMNESNCFLRDFADSFVKKNMIFIGTEFQEQDLWAMIEKYKGDGYNISGNQYFFITPSINNRVMKRWIGNQDNVYWIKWTTKQFLDFLHNEITVNFDLKNDLKEKGLLFLEDKRKEVPEYYNSEIYTGKESRYADFFENWDIEYPGINNLTEKISKCEKNLIVTLYGKSYTGKTCCAKRVLVNLWNQNYICCQFEMRSSEYMQRFIDYLNSLPQESKVAVLFEEASFFYTQLYNKLLSHVPTNISQLVIISTDTIANHISKRAFLKAKDCLIEFEVYETINLTYSKNIYNKLKSKNWFGRLLSYCDEEKDIPKFAREVNDIIEFLYYTSQGKGFENYFEDLLVQDDDEVNAKYLYALCSLEVLGVESIPQRLVPNILPNYKSRFNYKKFVNKYSEILIIKNYRIKVRCLRLIQNVIKSDLTSADCVELLRQIVIQTVGQFNEGDTNEWTELFQKVLLVKRLLSENILPIDQILLLLTSVENECEKYSYYWIQRGIAEQKVKKYETADNYFRKATNIRPTSYQARHALAKNLMERGINEYREGDSGYAPYYYSEGQNEMKKIIEDKSFSRAYRYSVHAYIDMLLKYLKTSMQQISIDEAFYIQSLLIRLEKKEIDEYMSSIVHKFISYCDSVGMSQCCKEVRKIDWSYYNGIKTEKNAYEIENLDAIDEI